MTEQELLNYCNKYLSYNPETGIFIWIKKPTNNVILNKPLLKTTVNGYRSIRIKKKGQYHHRLAYLIMYGYMPDQIDHIDNDRTNNKISNLRPCSTKQNNWNTPIPSTNKSGYKGVSRHSFGKWRARLMVDNIEVHLGLFDCKHKAAQAYNDAVIKYRDADFSFLNEVRK